MYELIALIVVLITGSIILPELKSRVSEMENQLDDESKAKVQKAENKLNNLSKTVLIIRLIIIGVPLMFILYFLIAYLLYG